MTQKPPVDHTRHRHHRLGDRRDRDITYSDTKTLIDHTRHRHPLASDLDLPLWAHPTSHDSSTSPQKHPRASTATSHRRRPRCARARALARDAAPTVRPRARDRPARALRVRARRVGATDACAARDAIDLSVEPFDGRGGAARAVVARARGRFGVKTRASRRLRGGGRGGGRRRRRGDARDGAIARGGTLGRRETDERLSCAST